MVYSFISYFDFMYEMTVHLAECSGRGKAVRIGISLYSYLITKN